MKCKACGRVLGKDDQRLVVTEHLGKELGRILGKKKRIGIFCDISHMRLFNKYGAKKCKEMHWNNSSINNGGVRTQ